MDRVDPFHLIPVTLPVRPRVLVTPAHLEFTRASLATCAWRRAALQRLLTQCAEPISFRDNPSVKISRHQEQLYYAAVLQATRLALAFQLTRQAGLWEQARRLLRDIATASMRRSPAGSHYRVATGDMNEALFLSWFACAYDLVAVEDANEPILDELLAAGLTVIDANPHRTCSNHNTWGIRARLSIAAACGDREGIHTSLYGTAGRYGFVHQLQHDLLADGMEWEHNLRHHFLTLEVYADIADRCRNLGIDLWHRSFPAAMADAGADLHGDYGPAGDKWLKSAFDAPLYQMFPTGEFSMFGDSRLSHLRGLAVWGIFYNLAYQARRDPRHAWPLQQLERAWPVRSFPELPATLQTATGDLDFVRVLDNDWPAGECPWAADTAIGLTGQHRHGSTLLPSNGSTMLRADPADRNAPAAFIFWGAHSGGHQGPGALNLELSAGGQRLTDAPWSASFDDPLHLTWCRTTIAHNTVTVDETPMFPYHEPTDSIWQSDYWQKQSSASELVEFTPNRVRVANARVYPGVLLERTVIIHREYVLDLFRCASAAEHQYDWAIHFSAERVSVDQLAPVDLGQKVGYRHLRDARLAASDAFRWQYPKGQLQAQVCSASPVQLIVARGPEPTAVNEFPGSDHQPARACSTLIARCRERSAVFATLFTFGSTDGARPQVALLNGSGELRLKVSSLRAGDLIYPL